MTAEIIVIPGAWTRASAFDDVRDALRAGGRDADVVELPSRANRLPQFDRGGLSAIDAVLDERVGRCAKPPILVGHSLGGLMALRAARRHAVRAMVLLMPAPPTGMLPDLLKGTIRRPVHTVQMLGAALSVTSVGRLGFRPPKGLYSDRATPEDMARGARHRADESWRVLIGLALGSREPVRPLGIPTLVIGGAQDSITPPDVLEPLAEALHAEFEVFDIAHAFSEEPTFELVTDAILDFLDRSAV